MNPRGSAPRGLLGRQSLQGAVGRKRARYVHQLRIGCLELERERLLVERAASARRVQRIDDRLRDIAAEVSQQELMLAQTPVTVPPPLQALAEGDRVLPSAQVAAPRCANEAPRGVPARLLRY